jgi:hypothetical protein
MNDTDSRRPWAQPPEHNVSALQTDHPAWVVEAAGIQPATSARTTRTKIGRQDSCLGREDAQAGQQADVVTVPDCKGRTGHGLDGTIPGRAGSTTGAPPCAISAIRAPPEYAVGVHPPRRGLDVKSVDV